MRDTVILIVDDDKSVLDSLTAQLTNLFEARHEVEAAESAEEAMEVLEELLDTGVRVVVVVSDWLMPGRRGDQLLASIRQLDESIGRILLTGQADEAALARAHGEAKVHRILFKPWSPTDLRDAIVAALGER